MAFDFPASPSEGATYSPAGGPVYTYTGGVWRIATDSGAAPVDGGEYVMVNGVWRLKSQTFDLAGKIVQDIPVPAWGPTEARVTAYVHFTTTSNALAWRISVDGTTFPSGAGDYGDGGFFHTSVGAGAYGNNSVTNRSWWFGGAGSAFNVPSISTSHFVLVRALTNGYFAFRVQYNDWNGSSWNDTFMSGHSIAAAFPSGLTVKAIRWLTQNASPSATYGKITVEWLQ